MIKKIIFALLAAATSVAQGQVTLFHSLHPRPYLQFADSPFASIAFRSFFLEDFEGAFAPGFTYTSGWYPARGGPWIDSVDGDDGVVDGSGLGGTSFYSGGNSALAIEFNPAAPGGLPTHVGLVFTDLGYSKPVDGLDEIVFYASDRDGSVFQSIHDTYGGDGAFTGQTAEDRFIGIAHLGGISKILFETRSSIDWEVDHIQYGVASGAVPEASTMGVVAVLMLGGLAALRRGRRKGV